MNIQIFNQQNLFDATINFFKQLNINFNVLNKLSVSPKYILKYNAKNDDMIDHYMILDKIKMSNKL